MERDFDETPNSGSPLSKESESEQSLVGKFKSIISNTPLSKWFRRDEELTRSTVRRRENYEDEDGAQPPIKKVKLPERFGSTAEPVAGPSGIQSRKYTVYSAPSNVFNGSEVFNGHKDSDSEESTSGYSSGARIGSKELVCESRPGSVQISPLQTSNASPFNNSKLVMSRSLFMEKTSRSTRNTSLSSRRPSFNASSFNSSNQLQSPISPRNIINSPFYTGKTIYGGASAYGQKLGRSPTDLKSSLKTPVKVTPVNKSNESVTLGRTAKRILETLEQYNSPINDVKKIPTVSRKQGSGGMLTKFVGANPYIVRGSNKELQVPSVADLLKMKKKTLLQDSTEAVRQIASSSKSALNAESYQLGGNEDKDKSNVGKMKRKITAVRHKVDTNDIPIEVNLPAVALPISTLPKFDMVIPPTPPAEKSTPACEVTVNVFKPQKVIETVTVETEKVVQNNKGMEYKFSEPIIIADNIKSIVTINNFKFSEPLSKKSKTVATNNVNVNFKMPENRLPTLQPKSKNNGENFIKSVPLLKSGSVMDILGKKTQNTSENNLIDKFKPLVGSWECTTCMIRNPADKIKCAACETPKTKLVDEKVKPKGFGSEFKLDSNKWECSSCLVRNTNSDLKCVACMAPKPAPAENNLKITNSLCNNFKPPSDTWECPVCMIRNGNVLKKCAACEAPNPKPGAPVTGFGEKFKPPEKSWECSACLVRNKEDATKCIACETSRSGSAIGNGFGSSFGLKNDEWECSVCMVRNKSNSPKCQCCEASKPGGSLKDNTEKDKMQIAPFNLGVNKNTTTSFSFGIPSNAKTEVPKLVQSPSTIFGGSSKVPSVTTGFSFGIPPSSESEGKDKNDTSKPDEKTPLETPKASEKQFNFHIPATVNKKQDDLSLVPVASSAPATKPTFNFKPVTSGQSLFQDVSKANLFQDVSKANSSTTNLFNFGTKPSALAGPLVPLTKEDSQSVSSTSIFKFSPGGAGPAAMTSAFGSSGVSSTNNAFDVKIKTTDFKPPSTEAKTVAFGGQLQTTTAAVSVTTSNVVTSSSAAGFNFTTPSTFNFASSKSAPVPMTPFASAIAQGGFSFGGAAAAASSQSAAAPKVGFNFGTSSSNAPQTGFNFGAAVSTTSASTSSSGGFNFSAAAATFNPNIKPTFNFSESPITSFSAQAPGEGLPAPRKIKRALRRTQR